MDARGLHHIEDDLKVFARPEVFDLWVEAEISVALPLIQDYTVPTTPSLFWQERSVREAHKWRPGPLMPLFEGDPR